jgi:hypothetical protein
VLTIHEWYREDGTQEVTALAPSPDGDGVTVYVGGEARGALSRAAVQRVMQRYAKPLDDKMEPVESLDLGGGARLRRMRHLARCDVIARDYLVLESPGEEPIAELAVSIASALLFLVRAH